jgi:hypothetical protein
MAGTTSVTPWLELSPEQGFERRNELSAGGNKLRGTAVWNDERNLNRAEGHIKKEL